jgi:hypothetical protein
MSVDNTAVVQVRGLLERHLTRGELVSTSVVLNCFVINQMESGVRKYEIHSDGALSRLSFLVVAFSKSSRLPISSEYPVRL